MATIDELRRMTFPTNASSTVDAAVRTVAAQFVGAGADESVQRRLSEVCNAPLISRKNAIGCARLLLETGLIDEAETIFEALARRHSSEPPGHIGLAQVAMRRQNWTLALSRWDCVFAAFTPRRDTSWVFGRATALNELGRTEEASGLYSEAVDDPAWESRGLFELAQLATRACNWSEALSLWDRLLTRFDDQPGGRVWGVSRAMALLRLGRGGEAEAALRDLARANPESLNIFRALINVLVATGKAEVALDELEHGPFQVDENVGLIEVKFKALTQLRDFDAARTEFDRILARAKEPGILTCLFAFVPTFYEGWRRTAAWNVLREKAEAIVETEEGPATYATEALRRRLDLALRDYGRFLSAMRCHRDDDYFGDHDRRLRMIANALSAGSYPDWRRSKIFGIGLSRTGTTTLASALTKLGLNVVDFVNPITMELMSEDDLHLFDAFTDAPVCLGFEKYFYMFPNAKFVYTTRHIESWESSISAHWRRHEGITDFSKARDELGRSDRFRHGTSLRNINHILFLNHASFADAYRAHDLRVRRFFSDKPASKFLEFDILGGHGWPELCGFLGLPAPDEPFPWKNRDPSALDAE